MRKTKKNKKLAHLTFLYLRFGSFILFIALLCLSGIIKKWSPPHPCHLEVRYKIAHIPCIL